jgi:hypothetical protein
MKVFWVLVVITAKPFGDHPLPWIAAYIEESLSNQDRYQDAQDKNSHIFGYIDQTHVHYIGYNNSIDIK